MRSTASIKGHPIHPMLINFPFAYLAGGFVTAAAGAILRRPDLTAVSRFLVPAGILTGLAAAVPGIIDYTFSVPPESSGKERATKHALVNSTALALFAASWAIDRRSTGPRPSAGPKGPALPDRSPGPRERRPRPSGPGEKTSLTLKTLGMAAISFGGWLGGTLVYRNQIGVDHRYANAGKWDEKRTDERGRIELATGELELNQMKLVHAEGERIAVARTESGYAAFQDRCTHKGGPLSDGVLICGTVQCPWHGSQFDVHTGKVKCGPAEEEIKTYEVKRSPGQLRLT
jgi:nitrite reductase/ring-hydroxylating ferredoxin subunit/uncharacterized membrane protein